MNISSECDSLELNQPNSDMINHLNLELIKLPWSFPWLTYFQQPIVKAELEKL